MHLQNVTPKDESVFDEKLDTKDTMPSQTLGIFKHEFGSGGKIKSTWFLRQFSKDEAARKVRWPPEPESKQCITDEYTTTNMSRICQPTSPIAWLGARTWDRSTSLVNQVLVPPS